MKTFTFNFTFTQESCVEVEAESEEQAREMIEKMSYDWGDVVAIDWWTSDIELDEVTES